MALEAARARYPSLSFAVLDPESQLAFPDGYFHAVTSVNAIEHTARAAGVLRELARVMQVGGLLVLAFPNLLSPMRPLRRFTTHPRRSRYGPESGDSTWDALGLLWRNLTLQGTISVTQRPQFRPRQADLVNAERLAHRAEIGDVALDERPPLHRAAVTGASGAAKPYRPGRNRHTSLTTRSTLAGSAKQNVSWSPPNVRMARPPEPGATTAAKS